MNFNESQTKVNLAKSFAAECQAGARYQFMATQAQMEQLVYVKDTMKMIAKNEMAHPKLFYDYIVQYAGECKVEFEADYQTTTHVTTSEADGTSYKKLLCVAFDIALLVSYSSHSFYRFVYHDGVLEGLDDRVKQRLIMVTQRICSEYGLQYILSLIDSDIPKNVEDANQEFPMDSVCLNLNDLDDSGKLFMRSF
mgnify:CR=1 FL=1